MRRHDIVERERAIVFTAAEHDFHAIGADRLPARPGADTSAVSRDRIRGRYLMNDNSPGRRDGLPEFDALRWMGNAIAALGTPSNASNAVIVSLRVAIRFMSRVTAFAAFISELPFIRAALY
ncbi:hypothetical protein [Burkholderia seminalis]|uniref:hypothetical protein n=1 Tax=Burkholderia seminalis TaxID=488731 RepID=UPI002652717B|nr:hypothetical protein [Burkholderia seminalis]MDN7585731.1 hypothetical protein [Burkholderia seminalis]